MTVIDNVLRNLEVPDRFYKKPSKARVARIRDRDRVDITLPGTDQVTHNVKTVGTTDKLSEGDIVPIIWTEEKGFSRPIVVTELGTDYLDNEIFYVNEKGQMSIKPGSIGIEHLNFEPLTGLPSQMPITHIVISQEEPNNTYPGLFWLDL